jgi:hypothetical protein
MNDNDYITKADDFISERGESNLFQVLPLPFAIGQPEERFVHCATGTGLSIINRAGAGLVALCTDAMPIGIYIPLQASQLRNLATGCLSLANELDGGEGKQ